MAVESNVPVHLHVGRSFGLSRRIVLALIAIWAATLTVGLFPADVRVLAVLVAAWAAHVALERLFRRMRSRDVFLAVDALVKILLVTAAIHLLGGPQATSLPLMYIIPIVYHAVTPRGLPIFLTANVAAACYATLMLLEARGVLAHHDVVGTGAPPAVAYAQAVVVTWVILNVVAAVCAAVSRTFAATAAQVEAANAELAETNAALRSEQHALEAKVEERTRLLAAANRALAEKARALESRQEDLRTFVYAVTHDLKAPLTNILLTADLVRDRDGARLQAESREDLARIERLAESGEAMIQNLIALFRITSAPEARSSVPVDGLVALALEDVRSEVEAKGVRVRVGPLPRVWGETGKLRHVLANLLGNAVKYVPPGSGEVEVTGRVEDGSVVLCVRDNGVGIAPEYHRAVFDVFRRVPGVDAGGGPQNGSGVGLAIVKRIVEAHGGEVWVESAPGAGSRFFVRLPAGPDG